MISKITNFFGPPIYENFEMTEKSKFLHISLLVAVVVFFLLGVQNMKGETNLDLLLFLLSGISLLCVPLNKRGYYRFTAYFIATMILVTITFSLIDGVGVWDAGLIAYPIFIIFASFLFNKQASPITTTLSIVSVVLVYYLDRKGILDPSEFSNEDQLAVIITLFVSAGFLLWAIMDNWERILMNLRETYDMTLMGWAKALEYRDQETEGHSQRVTELCVRLAKRLGVHERKLNHIRRGALLHDIGKMAIPDAILLKDSDLTEDEWEIVKKHPGYARDLLKNIPFLKPAIKIPYSHHERWDGSGYPEGLTKEDIPLAARIFAVVDVWDALLSDRPYRKAWPRERVVTYVREQSGKLFDPQVVDVFFDLVLND
jgi:putative nucleotidyltransferase with HDIG domain